MSQRCGNYGTRISMPVETVTISSMFPLLLGFSKTKKICAIETDRHCTTTSNQTTEKQCFCSTNRWG